MEQSNPLQRYFRQPAIYIKLPSNGQHYPPNSLNYPENGEVPVYPMTALDEITYRTADALFNGSAVVNVIESCVPAIKDAWQVPSVDLDTILIGIRVASYGHQMEFESSCPHCTAENNYEIDLRQILESLTSPDYAQTVIVGDVEIFFKPLSYSDQNSATMAQFEDQKLLEMVPNSDLPDEEKIKLLSSAYLKLGEMTLDSIAHSIHFIVANNETVTERAFIQEFVRNADRKIFNLIRDQITKFKKASEIQPLQIECSECQKPYSTPFTMDVSNFFE